jgi:glycosyltransferase involved in cell wall biosynthesis
MKKISWFTPGSTDVSGDMWHSQGYPNAAIATIRALQEKQVGVFYNKGSIPFHVNFCQPIYYQLNRSYTVGYTPWESTKVPESWAYPMSQCDEIWATSSFVKEVYEKNNLHHNIHVIPHGISSDFEIYDREVIDSFNFLHIGGDSKRKNAQMVVDAFIEVYEGNPFYKLILKYNNYCDADVYLNGKIVPATEHPQIYGIPQNLNTEELVTLYHKCHCLVYPTSGEGFGMIPFEAISTGMPSIVTDLTGTADFAKYSIPLEATWGEASKHHQIYREDVGDWALPDYDQLCNLMEHVVNEYDDFKKYTLQSARILHEKQSWSAVADMIINRLDEYEKIF